MYLYTDAIVTDLANALADQNIPVYGGSTETEWDHLRDVDQLPIPNVLIMDKVGYRSNSATYRVCEEGGTVREERYSLNSIPIGYTVIFSVFAHSREEADQIGNSILDCYGEEATLSIPNRLHPSETLPFTFQADRFSISKDQFDAGEGASSKTVFTTALTIHPNLLTLPLLFDDNTLLQIKEKEAYHVELIVILQMLQAALANAEKTKKSFQRNYETLTKAKVSRFSSLLLSKEEKMLNAAYNSGAPLDRAAFEKRFADVIGACPDLYERIESRQSADSIMSAIEEYYRPLEDTPQKILRILNLPESRQIGGGKTVALQDNAALEFIADALRQSKSLSVDDAVRGYLQKKEDERREAEAAAEALVGAIGEAMQRSTDRRMSESVDRLSGAFEKIRTGHDPHKADLWGTAACKMGETGKNGWKISNCMECPKVGFCNGRPRR